MSIASLSGRAMQRKSYPDKERSIYDNDLFVSPISERTPSWSGTRWTRFFPELSSHFSLISPVSTHNNDYHQHNNNNNNNNNHRGSGSLSSTASHSQKRHSSSDSEDTESKTGPSSLWSDELVDDASSCYSRRSSVTSLGSEISASAYKSPDAFSIISPARAGVFDDSASASRSRSSMSLSRRSPSSAAESRDKPLPCEPPIQMAPLSIRHKNRQPATIREDIFDEPAESSLSAHKQGEGNSTHQPTLSQAAKELENALAGLVEHKDEDAPLRLDAPLQISRGNMDMITTRAAPIPPLEVRKSILKAGKASPDEEARHAKKPHKVFSFSVPGFGRKQHNQNHRPHLRSLSSSSVTAGLERRVALQEAAASREAAKNNGDKHAASSGFLSPPLPAQRPASVSSERELRLKLPRLQTKDVRSSGVLLNNHLKPGPLGPSPPTAAAPNIVHPLPKPRKTFSFEPEGMMSKNISQPVGPYCEMEMDSGPIVIYELDAGPAKEPVSAPTPFVPSGEMPDSIPDDIVYMILRQCSSLQDLFNFAVMNRRFYRVFKLHELDLIQASVFAMSPPAWELREMSPPWDCEWQVLFDLDAPVPEYNAALYLDRYTRDLYTLVRLKSLILARCGTFLRPETIRGLAGLDDARASEIDNAFWRIWSFCRIFGCGKGREGDVVGQLDWLNGGIMAKNQHASVAMSITEPFGMNNVLFEPPEGFGRGNHGGLSQSQLYDMTEIWTCLGVLLQPIHEKCAEARKAGIFKDHDCPEKDAAKEEAVLEEWTSYILTLGPSAVLALGSIATVDNADEIFQRAQSMGLTKWEHDPSRSFFFREAVSKAYKPRNNPHKSPPLAQSTSNSSRSSRSSNGSPTNSIIGKPHRRRQAAYAAQLRNRRIQNQAEIAYAEERPISSYAEIMNRLAGNPPNPQYCRAQLPPPPPCPSIPPPPPPSMHQPPNNHTHPPSHSIQSHISTQTHNAQIPYHNDTQSSQLPPPPAQYRPYIAPVQTLRTRPAHPPPQIRDPADAAIDMMVQELGFAEEDAKWALKITDTGEGINPNAAVSLLIQEYQRQNPDGYLVPAHAQQGRGPGNVSSASGNGNTRNSILESVLSSREATGSGWRWA